MQGAAHDSLKIPGYEIVEAIGRGGMGRVFRAYRTSAFRREVAIKVIHPRHANDPNFVRQFEREAETISRLEHPHIVPLYDFWRDQSGTYLVMRFMQGGSLSEKLKDGPMAAPAAAMLMRQLCDALAYSHRNGVIHRDIKPDNILLDEDGNAYIADFGIAKDIGAIGDDLTGNDVIKGTPQYISPEQARQDIVGPPTDVYSLGVVLYEIMSGQHPFPGLDVVNVMYKHMYDPLPQITTLDDRIADAVNAIIQKATAKDPTQRYTDALDMAQAFRSATDVTITAPDASLLEQLTLRQHDILRLIVAGKSNKDISQELFIASATVKWHITQIYKKLGVSNRVQAIIRAREENLIVTPATASINAPTTDATLAIDALLNVANPYKGLQAFKSSDHNDFFGREKITAKLVHRVHESGEFARFLAVIGPSGSGKSSVVRAGLLPALATDQSSGADRWFYVEMLHGNEPLDVLEVALMKIAANHADNVGAQLQRDENGLVRVANLILPDDGSELLIFIDQFEEVFTLVEDEDQRDHFLRSIYQAVTAPRSRVRVVVTLRADFYDRPLQYPHIGEMMRNRVETLLPLSAEELERAIVEPAGRVGVNFEPGLVTTIIEEINYQPGALPLLQYALTELFERRDGRQLTRAAFQEMGGTVGALAKRADEEYLKLSEEGQTLARQLFLRMVTLGEGTEDTRRRTAFSELLALSTNVDLVEEIIDIYARFRLLSLDHDPGTRQPTVEVAHEAILREWERLRQWLNESRDDIKQQRQLSLLAEAWDEHNRDEAYLVRGNRLDNLNAWATETSLALRPLEVDFLSASMDARQQRERDRAQQEAREISLRTQRQRILQGLVAVFMIAALISGGLAIFAFDQQSQARDERDNAQASEQNALQSQQDALEQASRAEAARALSLMDDGFQDEAVESALTAMSFAETSEAYGALVEVVESYKPLASFLTQGRGYHLSLSGDQLLVGGPETVYIIDLSMGSVMPLDLLDFSPDTRMLENQSDAGCRQMQYAVDFSSTGRYAAMWGA